MKIPVTVYTLPNCVQCDSTKRLMDKLGIDYTTINLADAPDQAAIFRDQGHLTAPIVTTDVKIWSGFRYTKIRSLADHIHSLERN